MIFWVFFNLLYVLWVIGNNAGKEGYINTLMFLTFMKIQHLKLSMCQAAWESYAWACAVYTYWFMNILVIMIVISSDAVI